MNDELDYDNHTVEVIIPFSGGDPHRAEALNWICSNFEIPCRLAFYEGLPWSKGAALWPAIRNSEADIIVISDADVWCEGLIHAIQAIDTGEFLWARPHRHVLRLSESASRDFMQGHGEIPHPRRLSLVRPGYEGVHGGGIVVGRREVFLDCPMDPRFEGWGQEDQSFGYALWTLHGPPFIGDAPLVHLYHEPAPRLSRQFGSLANQKLGMRYHRAIVSQKEMLALVAEVHETLSETGSEKGVAA